MCILKWINWIISEVQWQILKILFVSASDNILVVLNREIGNGPWFEYSKFSWWGVTNVFLHEHYWIAAHAKKSHECEKQKQTLTRMNSALLIDEATKPAIPRIIPIIAII